MVAGRTADSAVKLVVPVLYSASLLPTVVLSVWATSYLTSHVFIRPDFYEWAAWPVIVASPGVLIGGAVFAGLGRAMLSLERLSRPMVIDHLRRCAMLYLVLVLLVGWVVASYSPTGSNYAFAFQIQALSVVCSAVFMDALILFLKRRSNTTNNAGGET